MHLQNVQFYNPGSCLVPSHWATGSPGSLQEPLGEHCLLLTPLATLTFCSLLISPSASVFSGLHLQKPVNDIYWFLPLICPVFWHNKKYFSLIRLSIKSSVLRAAFSLLFSNPFIFLHLAPSQWNCLIWVFFITQEGLSSSACFSQCLFRPTCF